MMWGIAYIQKALTICTILKKMAKELPNCCFWSNACKNTYSLFVDAS